MDKVWWRQVTNASKLIDAIVDSMLDHKNLTLILPEKVPWYHTMMEVVENETQKQSPDRSFDFIETYQEEPGLHIFNKYCDKEKQILYRPHESYAAFLAQNEDIVLNHKYIWVKKIPQDKSQEWINFVAEYVESTKQIGKGLRRGVFVLEIDDRTNGFQQRRGIKSLSFESAISHYDQYMFSALAASGLNCKEYLKPYLADISNQIARDDIELCAQCIAKGEKFLEDPSAMLRQILTESRRSNGSCFEYVINEEVIKKCIWEAQIKTLFPMIEKYRNAFIDKYRHKISLKLPVKTNFGEEYREVNEVEIGMLHYMATIRELQISDDDYAKLGKFKEARNTLAHLKILSKCEVVYLLEIANVLDISRSALSGEFSR